MSKFHDGDRVRLLPFNDGFEKMPEAFGTALGEEENGVVMVELDEKYREEDDADGLCEVPVEGLELMV